MVQKWKLYIHPTLVLLSNGSGRNYASEIKILSMQAKLQCGWHICGWYICSGEHVEAGNGNKPKLLDQLDTQCIQRNIRVTVVTIYFWQQQSVLSMYGLFRRVLFDWFCFCSSAEVLRWVAFWHSYICLFICLFICPPFNVGTFRNQKSVRMTSKLVCRSLYMVGIKSPMVSYLFQKNIQNSTLNTKQEPFYEDCHWHSQI